MSEENKPRPNKLMEKLQEAETEEANTFITEFIGLVSSDDLPKVPEAVFREVFLDAFINPETQEAHQVRAHWMGIVGSPTNAAEVVDITGKPIFRVPALVNTDALRLNTDGKSIREVWSTFAENAPVHPQMAVAEMVSEASRHLDVLYSGQERDAMTERDVKDWEKIFKYYGVIPNDGSTPSLSTPQAKTNVEDDFE